MQLLLESREASTAQTTATTNGERKATESSETGASRIASDRLIKYSQRLDETGADKAYPANND